LLERRNLRLRYRIVLFQSHHHPDPGYRSLLRSRHQRQCHRTANKCDKVAPLHDCPTDQNATM
jgi:hypothetical protein